MALRKFRDRQGVTWQVWAITGERLHKSTRAEDYIQPFLDGWLVFESEDGSQKRRHCPIPDGWEAAPEAELEQLCETAEVVRGPDAKMGEAEGTAPLAPPPTHSTGLEREVFIENASSRSFLYPGGRVWTAAEVPAGGAAGRTAGRSVLRFTAGRRSLDLEQYPDDWTQHSDAELAELLHRGFPRPPSSSRSSPHRRRRDDHHV